MELHVISNWFKDHPKKREYFEKVADKDLFPVVNFETQTIKANPLHKKLLKFGTTFEEQLGIIKKFIGAYVSKSNQSFETKRVSADIIGFKITPSLAVVDPFMHGWYSPKTREALEGAIQYYKPKTVVELGVWYGKSTVGMFQSSSRKLEYYGFDFFSPTATQPSYVTGTPIDKLFVEHFRLETAVANVASYSKQHSIHFVLHDVLTSHAALKAMDVVPDLLFIDAIKNTSDLQNTIDHYLKLNPDIVIVGDDYVFDSVKKAVKRYPQVLPFGNHSYILTNRPLPETFPDPVSNFSKYPQLSLTPSELKQVPKDMMSYADTN
jgi:predicted O-methyltransferase YrrM